MTKQTTIPAIPRYRNATPQYLELSVPLARVDGAADNSALRTVAVLVEAGFTIIRAEVHELSHTHGIEHHVKACVMAPEGRATKWVSALSRVVRMLRIDAVDIDEDESRFNELLHKLDAPRKPRPLVRMSNEIMPVGV
ncbi:hypothetical protein [Burkholderia multivorans]|uniref:hypothetical protein n=1 Tax=Burkholderia multivorans TaxID=87883 RepID=UPI001C25C7B3|nr:hypothetical protein [Burkholderia multivorans]MBU9576756.1 hypothetical protein [Burkholderia multivorans]